MRSSREKEGPQCTGASCYLRGAMHMTVHTRTDLLPGGGSLGSDYCVSTSDFSGLRF